LATAAAFRLLDRDSERLPLPDEDYQPLRRNRTVNWMSLRPYKRTWSQAYDFHPERRDATANGSAARGHTNSAHSTNLEFHRRYLSDIRGRDGFMASPSIRPSALNAPTGKCGRMTAEPRFTPASPAAT
jgi:hypothetical protein